MNEQAKNRLAALHRGVLERQHRGVLERQQRGRSFQWAELWIVLFLWKERGPKVRIYVDLLGSGE